MKLSCNADYPTAAFGDCEKLVWVVIGRRESLAVTGVQLRSGALATAADRVVGQQRHDCSQIVRRGTAKGD
jgi:hypothetical protein